MKCARLFSATLRKDGSIARRLNKSLVTVAVYRALFVGLFPVLPPMRNARHLLCRPHRHWTHAVTEAATQRDGASSGRALAWNASWNETPVTDAPVGYTGGVSDSIVADRGCRDM